MEYTTSTPAGATPPPVPHGNCANCGAPLYGKYCYACGQLANAGQPRHFHDMLGDFTDVVINVDGRLFSSIGPLYLRPGRLALDYFAGKRARYLPPFRLVFFLAVVTFIAAQLIVRFAPATPPRFKTPPIDNVSIATAPTPGAPSSHWFDHGNFAIGGYVFWNRKTKPLRIGGLPRAVNAWLNDRIGDAQQHLHAMNSGTYASKIAAGRQITLGALSAAPVVLFLFLPLFALLLKIFYVFKKRLYMEHLIVAMYSHAFLMLTMFILIVIGLLRSVFLPHAAWLGIPLALLGFTAWVWIFVYLWLMQRRVYRQGWFMTTLKYWCIGWCYLFLFGFGWGLAMLISLTGA